MALACSYAAADQCIRSFQRLPIVDTILNGFYDASEVDRLTKDRLIGCVGKLMKRCCSRSHPNRPPHWWPTQLPYKLPALLLMEDANSCFELRFVLKNLLKRCARFYRTHTPPSISTDTILARQPYVRLERLPQRTPPRLVVPPTQDQFLDYFKLQKQSMRNSIGAKRSPTPKIAFCTKVPFSSDLGRAMGLAQALPESWKLRRIERGEWYINRAASPSSSVPHDLLHHHHTAGEPASQTWSSSSSSSSSSLSLNSQGFNPSEHVHWYQWPGPITRRILWSAYRNEMLRAMCRPLRVVLHRCAQPRGKILKVNLQRFGLPMTTIGKTKTRTTHQRKQRSKQAPDRRKNKKLSFGSYLNLNSQRRSLRRQNLSTSRSSSLSQTGNRFST